MIPVVIAPVIAAVLTIVLGPLMFYVIGTCVAPDLEQFPLGASDGLGDTIFLPWFNASMTTLVGFPFTVSTWLYSSVVGGVIAAVMTAYFVYWQDLDEWSRPEQGKTNLGTWYHAGFSFVQSTLIVASLSQLPSTGTVWLPLIGYLACVGYASAQSP